MSVELKGINKTFGEVATIRDLDLAIPTGELVALLGPSGCGKTTLLRIIAGLESPDSGAVLFDGQSAASRSVRDRRVGFVFQHYALFRHLTVFENIAFGLRVQRKRLGLSESQICLKVRTLVELVQMEHLAWHYPAQLSGGQRQRVALARSLALITCLILLRARDVLTKASQSLLGSWPGCVMISTTSPLRKLERSGTMRPFTLAPTQVLPTSE